MKEFGDINEFIEHLAHLAIQEQEASHRALEISAALVEKCAKRKIGEYQEQAGPFIAWQDLADSTKADRLRKGFTEDDPLLRTGDMRDGIEHALSADTMEAQIGSNSDIALYQEAGTQKIPPRSFLGGAMVEELPKIREIFASTLFGALTGTNISAALLGDGIVMGGIAI